MACRIATLAALTIALATHQALAEPPRPVPARLHVHHRRPFRVPPPFLFNNALPAPAAPEPFVPSEPAFEPGAPMGLPRLDYGAPPPPLAGGMTMTETRLLPGELQSGNGPDSPLIGRPKQAADRLAACWSPPAPPRGDTVEITLRFGFDRSGAIMGAPRVTYVKAAPGVTDSEVRESIAAAIKACTPMHFSDEMAQAAPGYPLSIRFIGRNGEDVSGAKK
jgi:hypothetical protein